MIILRVFASIDTAIMGRKTFNVARQMGRGSFGVPSMANYVFSRSQPPGEREGVVFVKEFPATLIRQLRKRPARTPG